MGMALTLIVLCVYWQVGSHDFVNLDDDIYVYENQRVAQGLTKENIVWAFTSIDVTNWHPVTWLSHMADVQFYGMNPRGHHLTSVFVHAASTLLLFLLLFRLTSALGKSVFVAALFALHPLHVESVAWVAERKDVLGGFFWFLTLLLYAEYVSRQTLKWYFLALFAFVLGLMSKPMLVTLPVIMLLLDFWPLNRFRHEKSLLPQPPWLSGPSVWLPLVKEKIPFFVCSLGASIVTIYAQHKGGAIRGIDSLPLWLRIENATTAYVKYIVKMIWPRNLAAYYHFPLQIPLWEVVGSLLVFIALTLAAVWLCKRQPHLFVGWFWFLVTMLPVIGLVQVGSQAMADRYTYIPLVGLFIATAWGGASLFAKFPQQQIILALLASILILTSTVLTWQQLKYWRNSIALFEHVTQVTDNNFPAHNNLGVALYKEGRISEAIIQYRTAINIEPNYGGAHKNLGIALYKIGDVGTAVDELIKAITIRNNNVDDYMQLASNLVRENHTDEAIKVYKNLLNHYPDNLEAQNNIGVIYYKEQNYEMAIKQFEKILSKHPGNFDARYNLDLALEKMNRVIE